MKESFIIEGLAGEKKLGGEIAVGGAKNEVLKLMAASILCKDPLTITNVPDIADVGRMAEIIEKLGGKVRREGRECTLDTSAAAGSVIDTALAKSLRSS